MPDEAILRTSVIPDPIGNDMQCYEIAEVSGFGPVPCIIAMLSPDRSIILPGTFILSTEFTLLFLEV